MQEIVITKKDQDRQFCFFIKTCLHFISKLDFTFLVFYSLNLPGEWGYRERFTDDK